MSSEGKGKSADVKWELIPLPANTLQASHHNARNPVSHTSFGGLSEWANDLGNQVVATYNDHWTGRLVGRVRPLSRDGTWYRWRNPTVHTPSNVNQTSVPMTMHIHSSTTPGVRFVPPSTDPPVPACVPPGQYYPAPAPVPSPIPVTDSSTFSCSKWRVSVP
jgi:hypothetical protein